MKRTAIALALLTLLSGCGSGEDDLIIGGKKPAASPTSTTTDDDAPPEVSFSLARWVTSERNGTVEIPVKLSAPSGKEIQMEYDHKGDADEGTE